MEEPWSREAQRSTPHRTFGPLKDTPTTAKLCPGMSKLKLKDGNAQLKDVTHVDYCAGGGLATKLHANQGLNLHAAGSATLMVCCTLSYYSHSCFNADLYQIV